MEIDLDVAADHLELAYRLRQEERASPWEPAAPCHIPGGDPATRVRTLPELHAAAADAHRAAGNGDLEHLHGAVTKEQLRPVALPAGEVEAGGVVAARLHAERVGDADVAAPPGTATAAANWDGGCRGTRRQDEHGNYGTEPCYSYPFHERGRNCLSACWGKHCLSRHST